MTTVPGRPPARSGPPAFLELWYRLRWPSAVLALALMLGLFFGGWRKVAAFTASVDALGDAPAHKSEPRMFDPRADIWFSSDDAGLRTLREIEQKFVAQDLVFAATEITDDPHGAFGAKSLERIARVTERIKKIPYVRNVRSLTSNPWIRWGEVAPGENGLIVSDLFDLAPGAYTEDERLYRMVVTLGARRAAKLLGDDKVRALLGPNVDFDDYLGEPRLLRSVVSEDGRTTAIQIQILRPKVEESKLVEQFGAGASAGKDAAPAILTSVTQSHVLDQIDEVLRGEQGVRWHLAGIPVLERYFPIVSKRDMPYIGLLVLAVVVILFLLFRRVLCVVVPLLVMLASILGMNGTVWLGGGLLTNLTAVAPNVLIAVGIGNAVHLITSYFALRPRFFDKRSLLIEVLRVNWIPALLTSVTTCIGFFSLMTSDVTPMGDFGYTLGAGTLYAYVLAMTVVPAFLSLLPVRGAAATASSAGDGGTRQSADRVDAEADDAAEHPRTWISRLVGFTIAHRRAIVAATLVLGVLSGVGMWRMRLATDMRSMFPKDDPVRSDLEWIADKLGGSGDLELLFKGPQQREPLAQAEARAARIQALELEARSGAAPGLEAAKKAELAKLHAEEARVQRGRIATSAEFLGQVDALQARLEQESRKPGSPLAKLTSFESGLSVLRKMHQVQNENRLAFYRVPAERDIPQSARQSMVLHDEILGAAGDVVVPGQSVSSMVSQYYLQFESGAQPSESLSTLITQDRSSFRISARLDQAPTDVLLAAFARIRDIVRQEFPTLQGTAAQVERGEALATMDMSGRLYLYMHMFEHFVGTLVSSLSTSLLTISLLFALVFRSLRLGVVSMIPNILPVVLPLGIIGLFGYPLDGPVVLVASIVLGVCVDDTTHILWKYQVARRHGHSVDEALRRAFETAGAAVSATTVILVLGFAMLTFSRLRPNIVIGYMSALMLALAWACEFVLMPAVIRFFEKESV